MPCSASRASVPSRSSTPIAMCPYARAELVGAAVLVVRQLELFLLVGEAVEVERRLLLAVADDRRLAPELVPERLVERAAARRVGDAEHGVEITGRHAREPYASRSSASSANCTASCQSPWRMYARRFTPSRTKPTRSEWRIAASLKP